MRPLTVKKSGESREWKCCIKNPETGEIIPARICAIRKTAEQIVASHKKLRRKASKESLLELGHLPKTTDESSRAWLYGKLLIAFLVEKIGARNGAFSPWCDNKKEDERKPLDDFRLYIALDP